MAKKTIIVIAGKKQSGKDTFANQLALAFAQSVDKTRCVESGYVVNSSGIAMAGMYPLDLATTHIKDRMFERVGVVTSSFAELLKRFCVDVLGLSEVLVYGTDAQKRSLCHLKWDDISMDIRKKYGTPRWWLPWFVKPRSGKMSVREVLQVFGTDMIRRWCPDAWAEACYRQAVKSHAMLVVIRDGRFPNEIGIGHMVDMEHEDIEVISVRLQRNKWPSDTHDSETALDNYPTENYDYILAPDVTVAKMWQVAQDIVKTISHTPASVAA